VMIVFSSQSTKPPSLKTFQYIYFVTVRRCVQGQNAQVTNVIMEQLSFIFLNSNRSASSNNVGFCREIINRKLQKCIISANRY